MRISLIAAVARNRVIDWARRTQADRRDGRREVSLEQADGQSPQFAADDPGPHSVLVSRELLERVRSRLSPEERQLMEQRTEGREWEEIAQQLGERPNAVRMRLTRALDRVASELGLEESHG